MPQPEQPDPPDKHLEDRQPKQQPPQQQPLLPLVDADEDPIVGYLVAKDRFYHIVCPTCANRIHTAIICIPMARRHLQPFRQQCYLCMVEIVQGLDDGFFSGT